MIKILIKQNCLRSTNPHAYAVHPCWERQNYWTFANFHFSSEARRTLASSPSWTRPAISRRSVTFYPNLQDFYIILCVFIEYSLCNISYWNTSASFVTGFQNFLWSLSVNLIVILILWNLRNLLKKTFYIFFVLVIKF